MNAIDYFMITYNLRNGRIQITSDYMKKCNRLQITITPCLQHTGNHYTSKSGIFVFLMNYSQFSENIELKEKAMVLTS